LAVAEHQFILTAMDGTPRVRNRQDVRSTGDPAAVEPSMSHGGFATTGYEKARERDTGEADWIRRSEIG